MERSGSKTGRKPGTPKTGGRKKGTPNKTTAATRERIEAEADPIGRLIDISLGRPCFVGAVEEGKQPELIRPTDEQQMTATLTLAKKVMPDMKAIEHSGEISFSHEEALKQLK